MKTTLNIDAELYRRLKAKAALEGRKVTELIEEGVRGLSSGSSTRLTGRRTASACR